MVELEHGGRALGIVSALPASALEISQIGGWRACRRLTGDSAPA